LAEFNSCTYSCLDRLVSSRLRLGSPKEIIYSYFHNQMLTNARIGDTKLTRRRDLPANRITARRVSVRLEEAAVAAQLRHARTGEIRLPPTPTGRDPVPPPHCRPHAGSVAARADEPPRDPPGSRRYRAPGVSGRRSNLPLPHSPHAVRSPLHSPAARWCPRIGPASLPRCGAMCMCVRTGWWEGCRGSRGFRSRSSRQAT
jgi:hypothetical protein